MKKSNVISFLILLSFVVIIVLHHLFAYTGHYGFDDIHYAQLANDLLHGKFDFNDHFTYRLPVILLTALSYKLFGISDFASSLPSLIIAILILTVVYSILKNDDRLTLISGLSLTTFH